MARDGFENFEVTDDDYRDAVDPTARKRKRFTKDDAIYGRKFFLFSSKVFYDRYFFLTFFLGMWAEDGDSDDDRPSFGGSGKGGGRKDFTAPLSFVAGGVKEGSEKGKNREANVPVDDDAEVSSVSSAPEAKVSTVAKLEVFGLFLPPLMCGCLPAVFFSVWLLLAWWETRKCENEGICWRPNGKGQGFRQMGAEHERNW